MTFDVILQKQDENNFLARPVLWPDSSVNGKSQQDALRRVRALIRDLLTQTQVVQVDVEVTEKEYNPWIAKAGIFADDPTWDEFQEAMAEYRREVDAMDED